MKTKQGVLSKAARASLLLISFLAVFLLALHSATPAAPDFVVEKNVAVPMRDGVALRADVWRPRGDGKFPVLVYRTPYGKRDDTEGDTIFHKAVKRGYAVVMQDVRGRYASAGEYQAYPQEGRDGYDTIEWAAAQPWSNGAVGTFGLSYPGAVQWLAAMERPPHLKAMVPAMTFSTPRNFFYSGGVFDMSWIGWVWNNIAPDVRVKKNLPGPRTGREAREEFRTKREQMHHFLPLSEMPELKQVAPWYYEWMRHPAGDPWWDWCELRGKYDRAGDVAVLNFSAWHDEAYGPEGATTNFNGLIAARKGQKDARTRLILGPWSHGVPGPEDRKVGDRDMGPAAIVDYDEIVLSWMDRYVRGIAPKTEAAGEKRVRYFVMGENAWHDADAWPLPQTKYTPFYLAGPAGERKAGGLENKPPSIRQNSVFVSEPANPVADPHGVYAGAHDYRALAERGDVLLFDGAPLERDTEVTGPIRAEIYLQCDQPDTDLWVRLLDVAPDGTALNLMSPGLDLIRASYRNGGAKQELLEPDRVYKLELKNLMTGNLFKKGHRIRVQVSTTFFPNFSRNLHTGKLEMDSAEMRKATIRIHHDSKYPSRVVLPVIPH